jgi:phospho-N-acetylmuramoyl-pentapeptide-transferase
MHEHKKWTPTMWAGLFLVIMAVMIWISFWVQSEWWINNSLVVRQETYVLLFGFFSMWLLGLVDDIFNIKGKWKIKGLSAKAKLAGMFLFAGFISRWFYAKLGIDYINFRPIAWKISLGLFAPVITFVVTVGIVNAINITDGLDGLAGWLMSIILFTLALVTFIAQTYIATAVIAIVIACLLAFLWYNINPAKIFMWDSGAFALCGLLATLIFTLNMRMGIVIPFIVIFLVFALDAGSSALQIASKKIFKKKIFPSAPIHHSFEHWWLKETNIVMRAWMIQAVLAAIAIILIFYQTQTPSLMIMLWQ